MLPAWRDMSLPEAASQSLAVLALVAENEADAAKVPWVARLVERRHRR